MLEDKTPILMLILILLRGVHYEFVLIIFCLNRCNLASVVLQLMAMGISDVPSFDFMNKPAPEVGSCLLVSPNAAVKKKIQIFELLNIMQLYNIWILKNLKLKRKWSQFYSFWPNYEIWLIEFKSPHEVFVPSNSQLLLLFFFSSALLFAFDGICGWPNSNALACIFL